MWNFIFRFKLHLKVKDDTAETKLILLDWIATPLLGVKADKILDGSLEEVFSLCFSFKIYKFIPLFCL